MANNLNEYNHITWNEKKNKNINIDTLYLLLTKNGELREKTYFNDIDIKTPVVGILY